MDNLQRAGEFALIGEVSQATASNLAASILDTALAWKAEGKEAPITLTIYSGGGDVSAGFHLGAVLTRVREMGFEVITRIQGTAYSMALVIAQFGTRRLIDAYAVAHIHTLQLSYSTKPDVVLFGETGWQKQAASLRHSIINLYAARNTAGYNTAEFWHRFYDGGEYFFTAYEALQLGLVDEIVGGVPVPAFAKSA